MAASIQYELNNVEMTAQLDDVNLEMMYFQVSPDKELPFLINYDRKNAKWRCASGIYAVRQDIVEAIGKALEKRLMLTP